jgi:uncharacterized membrane protein
MNPQGEGRRLFAHVPPLLLLGAVGAWLLANLERLPPMLPRHVSMTGRVDRWVARTPEAVLTPVFLGIAAIVFLAVMDLVRRRSSVTGAHGRVASSRWTRLWVEYVVAGMFSMVALAPVIGPRATSWAVIGGVGLLLVGLVVAAVKRGRDGAPATTGAADAERHHWKGGLLYVNRDDPKLFVPKRFGIGFTLNFGRPGAYVLLALIVFGPMLVMLGVRLLGAR